MGRASETNFEVSTLLSLSLSLSVSFTPNARFLGCFGRKHSLRGARAALLE